MTIMVVCGLLLVAGLAAAVCWSGLPFVAPDPEVDLDGREFARRYAWYAAITLLAGIGAGITVIGAGGRLAMRLLAVTAGEQAQGRLTEADEVVGEISVGGTISFVLFNGIFGGVVFGMAYLVLRRFLPGGRVGGILYGLGLLAVFGATVDPLRRENPDFDIVGPGWLAVVVFTAMALAFGLAVAGIAARLSTWLPLLTGERRVVASYAPAVVVAVVAFSATGIAMVIGFVIFVVTRWRPVVAAVHSPRWVLAGRALIGIVVVVSLPTILGSMIDIATR